MQSDKEIKEEFRKIASKDPDKYYATGILKSEGFKRKKCSCGVFFWTTTNSDKCGDPACSGGYRFINNTPATKDLDYIAVWNEFSRLFSSWGYTPIKRYPVVARWRDDTDFVQASIYDFQPYVVSGEVLPPANPLVVPQFCLRFNDIDNVGITGSHFTGFVMIGQHAFNRPKEWNQEKYFTDIHNWLKKGIGISNDEITFHEDVWAGGGNFGPCMEYFSRGLELGNQVYMLYQQTPSGNKELNIKVLDMGMGHERNAWFSKATSTSYEAVFPTVCKKLFKITGIKSSKELMPKFLPLSSYLNIDEVENIDKAWQKVSIKIGINVNELKETILPLAALYSIGEHSRSLLVALNDGALPSNIGGGYNLRVILRRALSFIEKFNWNLDLAEICSWHASYLKPIFPELTEHLNEIKEILDNEKNKFKATREKSKHIVNKLIISEIGEKELLRLYDTQGISPEIIREEAKKLGKYVIVPENFYAKVSEMHEKKEQKHATKKETELDLTNLQETKALYYDDYTKTKFAARVLKIIRNNVILDQTLFYPTSGGQLNDIGLINNIPVKDVFKQGNIIVHVLAKINFKESQEIKGEIDFNRREQLAQHHTATHIVNAAARKILGNHINQAGAKKTVEKAHLDITHYKSISETELEKIEKEANRIVAEKIPVYSTFMSRTEAEKTYGTEIYQGGAVPGKNIRIVDIAGIDTEACGGTHLKNTSEVGIIKLLKATKISDSIVRIEFTAGKASSKEADKEKKLLSEIAKNLNCNINQIPGRVEELFNKWKTVIKKKKQVESKKLTSQEVYEGDILAKTCEMLRTQPEHIINTIKRFKEELEKA